MKYRTKIIFDDKIILRLNMAAPMQLYSQIQIHKCTLAKIVFRQLRFQICSGGFENICSANQFGTCLSDEFNIRIILERNTHTLLTKHIPVIDGGHSLINHISLNCRKLTIGWRGKTSINKMADILHGAIDLIHHTR
jgi:hypothetical protein